MWTWGYQDYSSHDIHSQAFQHHVEVFYLFLNSHSMFLRCEVRLITAPNLNDHYENWMRLYKMTSSGSLTYKQGFLLLFNTFYYHLNMLRSLWGWLFPFQVLPPTLSVSCNAPPPPRYPPTTIVLLDTLLKLFLPVTSFINIQQ